MGGHRQGDQLFIFHTLICSADKCLLGAQKSHWEFLGVTHKLFLYSSIKFDFLTKGLILCKVICPFHLLYTFESNFISSLRKAINGLLLGQSPICKENLYLLKAEILSTFGDHPSPECFQFKSKAKQDLQKGHNALDVN